MCHTGGRRPARVRCDRGTPGRPPNLGGPGDFHQVPRCALGLNAVDARSGPPPGGSGGGPLPSGGDDERPKRPATPATGGVLVSRFLQRRKVRMCHAPAG